LINSKQKGKRGEREFAAFCREQGYDCRRTQQYCGNTGDASDVVGLPGIHIEVKRPKQVTYGYIIDALIQAFGDSNNPADFPIVAYKEDYGKWHVTMCAFWFGFLFGKTADVAIPLVVTNNGNNIPVTMLAEDWFKIYREVET
jgi:hypothetical protein